MTVEGPIYGDDKRQAFREAELFVLPTLNENFGLVVAEALAEGTPVICTRGAPWQQLEEHGCGWWIDPEVAEIEAALRKSMAMDATALSQMGQAGRSWMERDYTWDRVARMTMEAYRWILKGNEAPSFVQTD